MKLRTRLYDFFLSFYQQKKKRWPEAMYTNRYVDLAQTVFRKNKKD